MLVIYCNAKVLVEICSCFLDSSIIMDFSKLNSYKVEVLTDGWENLAMLGLREDAYFSVITSLGYSLIVKLNSCLIWSWQQIKIFPQHFCIVSTILHHLLTNSIMRTLISNPQSLIYQMIYQQRYLSSLVKIYLWNSSPLYLYFKEGWKIHIKPNILC